MHDSWPDRRHAKRIGTLKKGKKHPSSKLSAPTYAGVVQHDAICIKTVTAAENRFVAPFVGTLPPNPL
jgi:hypothetical protein